MRRSIPRGTSRTDARLRQLGERADPAKAERRDLPQGDRDAKGDCERVDDARRGRAGAELADEDTTGGFEHGGWHTRYFHDLLMSWVVENVSGAGGYLLGRGTYEMFAAHWPNVSQEERTLAEPLNALPKYVASRTLAEPLEWQNSTLLQGDIGEAVRAPKAERPRPRCDRPGPPHTNPTRRAPAAQRCRTAGVLDRRQEGPVDVGMAWKAGAPLGRHGGDHQDPRRRTLVPSHQRTRPQ